MLSEELVRPKPSNRTFVSVDELSVAAVIGRRVRPWWTEGR